MTYSFPMNILPIRHKDAAGREYMTVKSVNSVSIILEGPSELVFNLPLADLKPDKLGITFGVGSKFFIEPDGTLAAIETPLPFKPNKPAGCNNKPQGNFD